ncbi:MAG: DNA polymerase III subunit delta [Lachnospiraceae bacterium]|jgi:DNA polymerase-3 subunit delta|nr:DNA polymerase III subunit delta [Lachnospiraceae bacterium]
MPSYSSKAEPSFLERQQEFNKVLESGAFTSFFMISGEQAYLRNQYRDKVLSALLGDAKDQMNLTKFTGTGFAAKDVIDIAETLPFFAERRVVLFENTGLWAREMTGEADKLADYFGTQPETTIFVFSEPTIDRKRRLYTRMGKPGKSLTVLACENVEDSTLRKWIQGRFRKAGKTIEGASLALFRQYAGDDMMNIASEADKLISFIGEKTAVDTADIKAICTPVIQDRIFDLIDAIAAGSNSDAIGIYLDMVKLETPPQVILVLLVRQYNRFLQMKDLQSLGNDEIASKTGIQAWQVRKARPALAKYRSTAQIERLLDLSVSADADYKSGKMSDKIALESLINALSLEVINGK